MEGFAASAERLGPSGSGRATYYRTPPLAGGRCATTSSATRIKVSLQVRAGIEHDDQGHQYHGGRGRRIDFAF